MSRSLGILLFFAILGSSGEAWDLRRLPTSADRAKALAAGWIDSRDSLAGALVAAYQPGGPRRPGSTGVTAYRAWMHLWKWCELLSRNERVEAAGLLAAHLRVSAQHEKPVFYPPGMFRIQIRTHSTLSKLGRSLVILRPQPSSWAGYCRPI